MALNTDTGTEDAADNWPYYFQRVGGETELYEYLSVFVSELQRIDTNIEELYNSRFLDSASGPELQNLAAPLSVTRREGEADETLQQRATTEKLVAAADGTAESVEAVCAELFGEDNLDSIDVERVTDEPVLRFLVSQAVIDNQPLSEIEMEQLLRRSLPCGTSAEIVTSDTFAFAEDDGTAPSYGAGFNDGEWA